MAGQNCWEVPQFLGRGAGGDEMYIQKKIKVINKDDKLCGEVEEIPSLELTPTLNTFFNPHFSPDIQRSGTADAPGHVGSAEMPV